MLAMMLTGMSAYAQTGNISSANQTQQIVVPSHYNRGVGDVSAQGYAPTPPASVSVQTMRTIAPAYQPAATGITVYDGYDSYNAAKNSASAYSGYNSYTATTTTSAPSYGAPAFGYDISAQQGSKWPSDLSSRAALVVDAHSGEILFQKASPQMARPIASITKLMTAMVLLDSGADLGEVITIDASDFQNAKGDRSKNFRVGDRMTRGEMLDFVLIKSDNTAAKALARTSPYGYTGFLNAMNQKAAQIGMTKTNFGDASGLDPRNVASPIDLVKMVSVASAYNVIGAATATPNRTFYIDGIGGMRTINAVNTNRLVRESRLPVMLSKTGYISEAGYCLVVQSVENNRPVIMVLMNAKNSDQRLKDAEKILLALRGDQ